MGILVIETKEDSPEKLAAIVGKDSKYFLMAGEFNAIKDAINEILAPDALLVAGVPEITDDTVNVGSEDFVWRLTQEEYTNALAFEDVLPFATDGYIRTDIFVGTDVGTIYRIEGIEAIGTALKPSADAGTIELFSIDVEGDVIGIPVFPVIEDNLVHKSGNERIPGIKIFEARTTFQNPASTTSLEIENGEMVLNSDTTMDNTITLKAQTIAGENNHHTQIFQAKDGVVALLEDLEGLSSSGEKKIICSYGYLTFNAINNWNSWSRNWSNIMASDGNSSRGTGALTKSSFLDCNFIPVVGATKLIGLKMTARESFVVNTYELFVASFDLPEGNTARGYENNYQVLVQQSFTAGTTSHSFLKTFTIATHTLSDNSGLFVAYRCTSGSSQALYGVALTFTFE